MPQFRYKARDRQGVAITGVVEADSPKAVSSSLRELGYQVISVQEFGGLAATVAGLRKQLQRQRPQEIAFFIRQIALMVRSGLPLIDALESAATQLTSFSFRKIVITMIEDLKGGASFSEAMTKHPKLFPNLTVSMVRAGEAAGILPEVLERLAAIGEEELAMKGRIRSALAYPALLVLLSIGIVLFLLIAILPKFVGIFEEAGAELPLSTKILLGFSHFLQSFWYVLPVLLFAGIAALRRYARTPLGKLNIHRRLLKIPVLGTLLQKTILARFSRVMGSLLKSGIQAVPALAITQEVVGNEWVRQSMVHIREAVIAGSNLADPFRMSQVFPPTLVQMISAGEKTGSLDEILLRISDFYDGEVQRDLQTLTTVLEPMLLLVMGLIVGFLALSVLMPVFQLVRVFRR